MSNTHHIGNPAESANTPSIDWRIFNPVILDPGKGLAQQAPDTINNVASTLKLLAAFIGADDGSGGMLQDDEQYAFCRLLHGLAQTLYATSDALGGATD